MWAPIAKELSVPWRAAEAMHWALGEQEMARRAGSVPFATALSGSTNLGNVSSSSSTPGMERASSGYGLPELMIGGYDTGEVVRESEEREFGKTRRQRRPTTVLQAMPGQQLAPVGQGASAGQGGPDVVLPSLAELTGGIPASAEFGRGGRFWESVQQGKRLSEREPPSQPSVKVERVEDEDEDEEEPEIPQHPS